MDLGDLVCDVIIKTIFYEQRRVKHSIRVPLSYPCQVWNKVSSTIWNGGSKSNWFPVITIWNRGSRSNWVIGCLVPAPTRLYGCRLWLDACASNWAWLNGCKRSAWAWLPGCRSFPRFCRVRPSYCTGGSSGYLRGGRNCYAHATIWSTKHQLALTRIYVCCHPNKADLHELSQASGSLVARNEPGRLEKETNQTLWSLNSSGCENGGGSFLFYRCKRLERQVYDREPGEAASQQAFVECSCRMRRTKQQQGGALTFQRVGSFYTWKSPQDDQDT